ncbi:outer membrane beta-barrel protein [uncultured Jannaschia sp.]|uniref:outer membrane protein n=1 Tax=Jannaschia halovivens TaxID=3388667 RepID=UPI002626BD88|nr:outer membrane beta-barrel protein [uncultured Jannaschia sp.]
MQTKLILPALALAFGVPVAATAGNLEPVAPIATPVPATVVATPVYDWSGFYIGGAATYADVDTSVAGIGGDGALAGLRLGFDYDFGSYVLGARLDYDGGSIDLGGGNEIESITRLGVRAGLDSGRNLYYGILGYADADTNLLGSGDGAFGGLGYEVFVTDAITIGTEVLYHDLDGFTGGADADATTASLSVNWRF